MAIPVLNHLDFNYASEARKLILHKTTESSATNTEGAIIYDTGTDTVKYRNASAWVSLTASTSVTVSDSNTNTAFPIIFHDESNNLLDDTGTFTYNPNSGQLVAPGEIVAASLDISGNVDVDGTLEADAITVNGTALDTHIAGVTVTTATTATNVTASANNSTDETVYPTFVDGATGGQGIETDTGLTYNPSSGLLTTTLLAGTLNTAAQTNVTSLGTLTALTVDNVVIDGAVIGHTGDTDLITLSSGVVTVAGEVDATSLDISGDADIDGTLEADAITVNGSTLASVIAGTTVSNATLAATVTVTDSTTNSNFPVVFHDESNALLDDTGALRYNPSTGTLYAPNLSVAGTTTTVDTVTMEADNAIIFEGATADGNETTLSIVDPTGDHTQYLINQGGYIPVLAAATTTAITSTPAELNLLDGVSGGTVSASLAVVVDGNKDIASFRNVTLTGELDAATGDFSGDVDVDGTLEADAITIGGTAIGSIYSPVAGHASIATVGTITSGTWAATDVGIAHGGTGASTASAAFTALKQDASATATGVVELATAAEVQTGTDTARAVTPDTLAAKSVIATIATASVDSSELSAVINHALGTTNLHVTATLKNEDSTTDYGNCIIDWECTSDGSTDSTNHIYVKFAAAPPSDVVVNISSIAGGTAVTPTYPS